MLRWGNNLQVGQIFLNQEFKYVKQMSFVFSLSNAAITNLGDRVLLSLTTFDNRINAEEGSPESPQFEKCL